MGRYLNTEAKVSDLLGKTLVSAEQVGDDFLRFTTVEGDVYGMTHYQDCCESVTIDDVTGNLADLVGSPITLADESTNEDMPAKDPYDSYTWTFYRFATIKGYVDIRWYGSSNGYYSESVDFFKEGK